jgi:hypothetical protein
VKWSVLGIFTLALAMARPLARAANDRTGAVGIKCNSEKLRLLSAMLLPWRRVSRLEIEYSAIPSRANLLPSVGIHQLLAVASPGSLYELTAHAPGYAWQTDPYSQELSIRHGEMVHGWPFNRAFSEATVQTRGPLPGTAPANILWTVIPIWLLTDYKVPNHGGTPVIAADALALSDYQLLSGSGAVNGEPCSMWNRNGIDRMWIARDKGLCVMRRDSMDPKTGDVVQRILTDKVTEIAPGLWLPTQFRREIFAFGDTTNRGALVMESTVAIERCLVNDEVSDSTFVVASVAGSVRYDANNQFAQVCPGGEDLLERIVAFLVKYGRMPTARLPQNHARLWCMVGMLTGALVALLLIRGMGESHHRSAGPKTPST